MVLAMKSIHSRLEGWRSKLPEVLGGVSVVSDLVVRERADSKWATEVDLRVGSAARLLLVATEATGQPRHVRSAAAQLFRAVAQSGARAYGVLVAPFLSPQSRAILRADGLGWLDLAGNLLLSFDTMHLEIDVAQRDPFATPRRQRSLFAPRSARVLHELLSNAGPWKVVQLAERAGVSLGQVSNVRRQLLDKEWAVVDPAGGIRLVRPAAVLDAWRDAARPPEAALLGYTVLHGSQLEERLQLLFAAAEQQGAQVMFAGHSVARRIAPYVRQAGEYFYADAAGTELVRRELELVAVDRGESITIYQAPDPGIWSQAAAVPPGMRSAGAVQTYLDLWCSGERGREAADHFRREMALPVVDDR